MQRAEKILLMQPLGFGGDYPVEYDVTAGKGVSLSKAANNRNKGGAPFGNKNAYKHGMRSRAYIMHQRLTRARLKALAHIAKNCNLLADDGTTTLPRPIRADQWLLLQEKDPLLVEILAPHVPWPKFVLV